MYLPKRKPMPKSNPFRVQYSYRFLYASGVVVLVAGTVSAIFATQQVQQRGRRTQRELAMQRPGQRVVIIGAGPAGCALAASLCNSAPDLHVTVVEKERKQTFTGAYPYAHVGHRSYDLNTSGGIDFLRSPTSWNVTRDANLVSGEVTRVLTSTREVVVAPTESAAVAFSSSAPVLSKTAHGRRAINEKPMQASSGWLQKVWGSGDSGGTAPSAQTKTTMNADPPEQPYRQLSDGSHAYPYDVLIIACGAKRTLGPLEGLLPHGLADLDRYGIAVNPGVTRDTLSHLFQGNILHVKVPPKSFCALMEAERKAKGLREPAAIAYDSDSRILGTTEDPVFFEVMARLNGLNEGVGGATASLEASAAAAAAAGKDCTPQDGTLSPPLHPYMLSTSRQHDSTFASTTNTIWKYLDFFSKFSSCQLISVSADADPLGPAPVEANEVVRSFWQRRRELAQFGLRQAQRGDDCVADASSENQLPQRVSAVSDTACIVETPGSREKTIVVRLPEEMEKSSSSSDSDKRPRTAVASTAAGSSERHPHFHFLSRTYLTAVDPEKQLVTLYNYAYNVTLNVPYRLLLLDLPLKAPPFLAQSGLARSGGAPHMAERTGVSSPLLRGDAAEAAVSDEASFADVDPATLQHRRFTNVFAIGDAAGLPTAKSVGAALAQVPVVAHNVKQELYNQRAQKRILADEEQYKERVALYAKQQQLRNGSGWLSSLWERKDAATELPATAKTQAPTSMTTPSSEPLSPPVKPSTDWFKPRTANAIYDGYSSYHVVMTTWRAMWPEMSLGLDDVNARHRGEAPQHRDNPDLTRRMRLCNNHLWDNLAWRDARGFANGFFCQMSLYEHMQFFVFNRGAWYPPGWFSVPTFSVADGSQQGTNRGWFRFL